MQEIQSRERDRAMASRLSQALQAALQVSSLPSTCASPCITLVPLPALSPTPSFPHWLPACFPFRPAQDYELQADTYRCSLEPTLAVSAPKRPRVAPLQESIHAQVRWDLAGLSGP